MKTRMREQMRQRKSRVGQVQHSSQPSGLGSGLAMVTLVASSQSRFHHRYVLYFPSSSWGYSLLLPLFDFKTTIPSVPPLVDMVSSGLEYRADDLTACSVER